MRIDLTIPKDLECPFILCPIYFWMKKLNMVGPINCEACRKRYGKEIKVEVKGE